MSAEVWYFGSLLVAKSATWLPGSLNYQLGVLRGPTGLRLYFAKLNDFLPQCDTSTIVVVETRRRFDSKPLFRGILSVIGDFSSIDQSVAANSPPFIDGVVEGAGPTRRSDVRRRGRSRGERERRVRGASERARGLGGERAETDFWRRYNYAVPAGRETADVPLGELTLQKAQLDELFARVPEATVLLDTDDRILQVNPEFTRVFGYTQEEACGRLINELIVPEEFLPEGHLSRKLCLTSCSSFPQIQQSRAARV